MKELNNIGDLFNQFCNEIDEQIAKSKVNALFCDKYYLEVRNENSSKVNEEIAKLLIKHNLLENVEVEYDIRDYPDFCDSNITNASFMGKELEEDILECINEDGSFVYECVINTIF